MKNKRNTALVNAVLAATADLNVSEERILEVIGRKYSVAHADSAITVLRAEAIALAGTIAANAPAASYVVDSQAEALNLVSELLKGPRVATLKVEIPKQGVGKSYIVTTGESLLARNTVKYTGIDAIVLPDVGGSFRSFSAMTEVKFSSEILKVSFGNLKVMKAVLRNGLFVRITYGVAHVYVPMVNSYSGNTFAYKDILTGKTVLADSMDFSGLRHYKGFNFTPSDVRTKQATLFDVTDGDNREEVLDRILCGSYGYKKRDENDKSKLANYTVTELIKLGGRFGNGNVSSKELPKIGNSEYGVMILKNPQYSVKPATVDGSKSNTWDGAAEFAARYMAFAYSCLLGVTVTPKAVAGIGQQDRTRFLTTKDMSMILEDSAMDHRVRVCKERHAGQYTILGNPENIIAIIDGDASKLVGDLENPPAEGFAVDLLAIAKDSQASLSMQILNKVCGVAETADVVVGKFAQTVEKDLDDLLNSDEAELLSVEEAEELKGYAAQIIAQTSRVDARENASIVKANIRALAKRYARAIRKLKVRVEGANLRIQLDPTEKYLINPEASLEGYGVLKAGEFFSKAYWNSETGARARKIKEDLDLLHEDKEDLNTLIKMTDDQRIIKEAKAGIKQLDKDIAKAALEYRKALKAVGFKYPTVGLAELMKLEAVDFATIKQRVNAMNITKEERSAIISFYATLSSGVVVLPAVPEIKNQCAGLDTDWDGMTIIWDADVVELFKDVPNEIVVITTPVGSKWARVITPVIKNKDSAFMKQFIPSAGEERYALNVDNVMEKGYAAQVSSESVGVGEATVAGQTFDMIAHSEEAARAMLCEIGNKGTGKYNTPFSDKSGKVSYITLSGSLYRVVYVCQEDADLIEVAIKNADLSSVENRRLIARDLNYLTRCIQELAIDSAKKVYEVIMKLKPAQSFIMKGLMNIGQNIEEYLESCEKVRNKRETSVIEFKMTRVHPTDETGNPKVTFDDPISLIQDRMVEIAEDAINKVMGPAFLKARINDEEMAVLNDVYATHAISRDLNNTVRSLYTSVITSRIAAVEDTDQEDMDEDTSADVVAAKEAQEQREEAFANAIAMLDNAARLMLESSSVEAKEERGILMKAVSLSSGNEKAALSPYKATQFNNLICQDYTMASIVSKPGSMKVCGYPLLTGKKDLAVGTALSFTNGKAVHDGKTIIIKSSFTGELLVDSYQNRLYAVKPIDIQPKKADASKLLVKVRKSFNMIDGFGGKFCTPGTFDDLRRFLPRAELIRLVPVYRYKDNGKERVLRDAIVVTMLGKDGSERTFPVGRYQCESAAYTKLVAGAYGTFSADILATNSYPVYGLELNVLGRDEAIAAAAASAKPARNKAANKEEFEVSSAPSKVVASDEL